MRTRLTQVAVVLALFSVHARIVQSADAPWAGKATYIPKLEKNLKENITAFWLSKSLDRTNGGYTINFGPKGEPKGPGTKMIVTQARTAVAFLTTRARGLRWAGTSGGCRAWLSLSERENVGREEWGLLLGSGCHRESETETTKAPVRASLRVVCTFRVLRGEQEERGVGSCNPAVQRT